MTEPLTEMGNEVTTRMDSVSPAEAAAIAGLVTACSHLVIPLARLITRGRVASTRTRLEALKHEQDRQDSSYKRLESENARLWNRVQNLETAVTIERDGLEEERRLHAYTRKRCEAMEWALRKAGIKIPVVDETGGPQ